MKFVNALVVRIVTIDNPHDKVLVARTVSNNLTIHGKILTL
jgi:hypothetical protein